MSPKFDSSQKQESGVRRCHAAFDQFCTRARRTDAHELGRRTNERALGQTQAFGTNPEVALFVESDGTAWNFGAGRLTAATTVTLTLDGSTAWEGTVVRNAIDSPYTASSAPAEIPGLAADGSEIEE